jgi:hypothetical protein
VPITDSRLRSGTLTLDGDSYATQATNVRIIPDYQDEGDAIETLDGSEIGSSKKRKNTLAIEAIQDFDDAAGFQAFTWNNDLLEVAFTWQPGPESPTYDGTVQVLAVEVGGDVGPRLTTSAEWEVVGPVTVTPYSPS